MKTLREMMDLVESAQTVAEVAATADDWNDRLKRVKVFKDKAGKPIGEIGYDLDAGSDSPDWYCHHYATGYRVLGFDDAKEATTELKYVHQHPEAVKNSMNENQLEKTEADRIKQLPLLPSRQGSSQLLRLGSS